MMRLNPLFVTIADTIRIQKQEKKNLLHVHRRMMKELMINGWTSYSSFLTNWMLTLGVLFCLDKLPYEWYSTLKMFVFFASVGGFYLTYVNPRKIVVDKFNIVLQGPLLWVFDVLSHHLPLVHYVYHVVWSQNKIPIAYTHHDRILPWRYVCLQILYLMFYDPVKIYSVTWPEIGMILVVSFVGANIFSYKNF